MLGRPCNPLLGTYSDASGGSVAASDGVNCSAALTQPSGGTCAEGEVCVPAELGQPCGPASVKKSNKCEEVACKTNWCVCVCVCVKKRRRSRACAGRRSQSSARCSRRWSSSSSVRLRRRRRRRKGVRSETSAGGEKKFQIRVISGNRVTAFPLKKLCMCVCVCV